MPVNSVIADTISFKTPPILDTLLIPKKLARILKTTKTSMTTKNPAIA